MDGGGGGGEWGSEGRGRRGWAAAPPAPPQTLHPHHPRLPTPAHKAVALECMRGAHRARRRCLLFAFSGPGDVRALDLRVDADALAGLLDFLRGSFGGGTDADAPLELSLERLEQAEWCQADILVVTDGEIAPPSPGVLARLDAAKANMGLEVHGLLVGRGDEPSEAVRAICSHVHVFKSWSAVGGR